MAGWPAISLLVSIKLLFSMFNHDKHDRQTVRDDQETDGRFTDHRLTDDDRPSVPVTTDPTVPAGAPSPPAQALSADVLMLRADGSADIRAAAPNADNAASTRRVEIDAVVDLLPAARAAHAALTASGQALSRDALAGRLRQDGHTVSNARLSLLLKALRTQPGTDDSGAAVLVLN